MSENKTNINWYPGHMAKTKRQIAEDLKLIDVVIEVLDARIPVSSQNPDMRELTKNKKKIYILNKCDLADEKETLKWENKFRTTNSAPRVACVIVTGTSQYTLLPFLVYIL